MDEKMKWRWRAAQRHCQRMGSNSIATNLCGRELALTCFRVSSRMDSQALREENRR
jgi:hypothetical protein